MANHAWAVFRKNIDLDVLKAHLDTYNVDRFGGCLEVARDETSITVHTPEGRDFYYWIRSSRKLEWAHTHGDVGWWLKESLGHYMCRAFQPNCVIRDEGIDDEMWADFDLKYPTAADWSNRGSFFTKLFGMIPHPERETTHPSYWVLPVTQ